jgi:hypothetical protein
MARKTANYDYDDYDDDYYDDYDDYDEGDSYSKPVQAAKPKAKPQVKAKAPSTAPKKAVAGTTKLGETKKGGAATITKDNTACVSASKAAPPAVFSFDQFELPTEQLARTSVTGGISVSVPLAQGAAPTNNPGGGGAGAHSGLPPSDDEDEAGAALAGREVLTSNAADGLTVIIVGHVDAGKSTLIGQLLVKLGYVSAQVLRRHAKEAAAAGKASFHFAWVMDENQSERAHGVTIDIAEK